MAVQGAYNHGYNYVDNSRTRDADSTRGGRRSGRAEDTKAAETAVAEEVVKEESTETTAVAKQQPETYKPDLEKIKEMKADLKGNMAAFKQMVYSQIKEQGLTANSSIADILKGIQGMSQEDAAKAVADDGEWGVDATANRILDFAKALSGGDPSKIDALRDAVEKGFKAAGQVWGGDLPEISHKTLEKVMEGFDKWKETGSADGIGTQAQSNAATQVIS